MCKLLRRLFWIALLGGAGYAVYTAIQQRRADGPPGEPSWPSLDDVPRQVTGLADLAADVSDTAESPADDAHDTAPTDAATGDAAPTGQRWAEPVDGECPEGYPIKGNADSGIYHVPGGRFYDRTVPERCYADEDDAIADGYRRSKA